jgi:hypothetical protein
MFDFSAGQRGGRQTAYAMTTNGYGAAEGLTFSGVREKVHNLASPAALRLSRTGRKL